MVKIKSSSKKKTTFKQSKTKKNISVSIIGHNEASHLKKLLPTLTWAKEVIYVDCESSDDSVKVARKYHCRVYHRKNNPNLNINKQFGISKAKGKWVIYLDTDERITETCVKEMIQISKGQHDYQAFQINRKNYILGRFLRYGDVYPDTQLRFFRNGSAYFPQKHIHEFLLVKGKIGKLNTDMLHFSYLDVKQVIQKFDRDTSFEAKHMLTKGIRPSWSCAINYILLKPIHLFILKYFFKKAILDGYPGLVFAFMSSLHFPIRFFKVWELTQKTKESRNDYV